MKHPAIDPLRDALRDLLCASEEYLSALARPSVDVVVARDDETRDDIVRRGKELAAAHLHARGVLSDLAERLAEDARVTTPALPDAGDDEASPEAREQNAQLEDDEIDARARRAARAFGSRS